jgi:ABC-2 type transport system ATP-binding protein
MPGNTVILANHINKHFKHFQAVGDLSLNIRQGEIYGFLGLNGAGKTTTIRMLLGMLKAEGGDIKLFGQPVEASQSSVWRRVGYMVESPYSYPDLSVRQNLEAVSRLRQIGDSQAVDSVIKILGLTGEADKKARHLSLGNQQRLGLAKALIHHPDLLILDEPANGLDPAGIVEIRYLLHNLAEQQGTTIFISSHILTEINRLASRIGIIHKGRLIQEFNTAELAAREEPRLAIDVLDVKKALTILKMAAIPAKADNNTLYIDQAQILQHPEMIATLLVNAGCPPTRLLIEKTDLEDYFLKLTNKENHK